LRKHVSEVSEGQRWQHEMEERLVVEWGEGRAGDVGASECLISSPIEEFVFTFFKQGVGY